MRKMQNFYTHCLRPVGEGIKHRFWNRSAIFFSQHTSKELVCCQRGEECWANCRSHNKGGHISVYVVIRYCTSLLLLCHGNIPSSTNKVHAVHKYSSFLWNTGYDCTWLASVFVLHWLTSSTFLLSPSRTLFLCFVLTPSLKKSIK